MIKNKKNGFSAIEMMVVVAVIAILAMMAIPSGVERMTKEQVLAALPLANIAQEPIDAQWKLLKTLPIDNKEAGLPAPDKVVSNFISALTVKNGVINLTFGNKANPKLTGKILSLRPAVIEEAQIVPIAWVCGYAKAPNKMVLLGANETNIEDRYLPLKCR